MEAHDVAVRGKCAGSDGEPNDIAQPGRQKRTDRWVGRDRRAERRTWAGEPANRRIAAVVRSKSDPSAATGIWSGAASDADATDDEAERPKSADRPVRGWIERNRAVLTGRSGG
jgi:hypothetical protein